MDPERLSFAEQGAALASIRRSGALEAVPFLCWLLARTPEQQDALADRWPAALSFVQKSKPDPKGPANPLMGRMRDA